LKALTKVANLNADKLDGIDSTGFLAVGGKAADSNLLDGLDSSQLIQGSGQAAGVAYAVAPGEVAPDFVIGPWHVRFRCPTDLTTAGTIPSGRSAQALPTCSSIPAAPTPPSLMVASG
jgi:hypothetical protein